MRAVSHIQFYCDRALRYSDGVHFSRRPGHSIVMIVMNVSQCMCELDDNPRYSENGRLHNIAQSITPLRVHTVSVKFATKPRPRADLPRLRAANSAAAEFAA